MGEDSQDEAHVLAAAAGQLHKTAAAMSRGSTTVPSAPLNIIDQIRARRTKPMMRTNIVFDRLARLGISRVDILSALLRTKQTGASVVEELISASLINAEDYFQMMARDLGVEYLDSIGPEKILTDVRPHVSIRGEANQIFFRDNKSNIVLLVAPNATSESAISEMIANDPLVAGRLCITCPATIRSALSARHAHTDVKKAVSRLSEELPQLSAKHTLTPIQSFILGSCIVALPVTLTLAFWQVLFALHLAMSVFFFAALALRLAAWWTYVQPLSMSKLNQDAAHYPQYSVMVALHKEAPIVAQLVNSIESLDWPKSKLEVLYVCEDDDTETIEALHSHCLPPGHRIVGVPYALPRTKPKALTYALPHCSGEFVVIYDAEDRPHKSQLKEAWHRFAREDETLACLQAPLVIANPSSSWWSRMFAFEYAAHFYGLLPFLARIGAPLPLGGTSNHFRKDILINCLGWDPYNVTEDADLGIRLSRLGYRCGVITAPTLEDAPTSFDVWLPQRTRWQKGWMQTLLVQNRNLRGIITNIGIARFAIFQVLIMSLILSPLLYIIALVEIGAFCLIGSHCLSYTYVAWLDLLLFACGHLIFYSLATVCEAKQPMITHLKMLISLPVYWIAISLASWRAVWQLIFKPHMWEKTPHLPSISSEVSVLVR